MQIDNMDDLINELKEKSGCLYISDLHEPHYFDSVINAINSIDDEAYPIRAWNDVVRYIAQTKIVFDSPKAAKDFLINELRSQK